MKIATRTEAVKALVQLGMTLPYARVAVNEQYNYDEHGGASDDKLRGNHEDLSISHIADEAEMVMVKNTWDEILSTEGDRICVDGEPNYDLNGILIHHNTHDRVMMRVDQLIDDAACQQAPATWWDEARVIAQENGDLREIAALCIAQLMMETGD